MARATIPRPDDTRCTSACQNPHATPSGGSRRPAKRSLSTTRMFDSLSERLRKTLANLTGRGRISEADVDAAMREIRLSLLEADVNFRGRQGLRGADPGAVLSAPRSSRA